MGLFRKAHGLNNMVAARAVLYHLEFTTRGYDASSPTYEYEMNYSMDKWRSYFERDTFYNPNLSLEFEDYSYNFPPVLKGENTLTEFGSRPEKD